MAASTIDIHYRVRLRARVIRHFDFVLNEEDGTLQTEPVEDAPEWTKLSFKQCSHCPLDEGKHPYCPLALQLHEIKEKLHGTMSYDEVDMEVTTPERSFSQTVELQQVVGSMVGLAAPLCGCPKTAPLKPMARFHLPTTTEEEELFRVVGTYLTGKYLGGKIAEGLDGLKEIYDDLHIVNKHMAARLVHETESDTVKNAVTLLDMYCKLIPELIDDNLSDISMFFSEYVGSAEEKGYVQVGEETARLRAEDLAVKEMMKDAEVDMDELEALLGTQSGFEVNNSESGKKDFGRATYQLPDDD